MTAPVTYIRKAFRSGNVVSQCILYVIGSHADNDTGECFLGLDTIADEAQCTRRAVQLHIKRLSDEGMLLFIRSAKGYEFKINGYEEHQNSIPKTSIEPYSTEHGEAPAANNIREPGSQNDKIANKVRHSAQRPANDVRLNSVVSEVSNNIYNNPPIVPPSQDWETRPQGVSIENKTLVREHPAEVARRVAEKAEANKISNKNWPRFNRFSHPDIFRSWMDWFETNGYSAQIFIANKSAEVWVPDADPKVGGDLFKRKNPIAKLADKCNAS